MRRWEEARRETPEDFEVLYPPPPLDADALRRLAESATRREQLDDGSSLEEPYLGRKDFLPVEPQSGLSFLFLPRQTQVRLKPLL